MLEDSGVLPRGWCGPPCHAPSSPNSTMDSIPRARSHHPHQLPGGSSTEHPRFNRPLIQQTLPDPPGGLPRATLWGHSKKYDTNILRDTGLEGERRKQPVTSVDSPRSAQWTTGHTLPAEGPHSPPRPISGTSEALWTSPRGRLPSGSRRVWTVSATWQDGTPPNKRLPAPFPPWSLGKMEQIRKLPSLLYPISLVPI